MTTRITVHALHGWPVDVTPVAPVDPSKIYVASSMMATRVPAGDTMDFYVHAGQDLLIHEVQPAEIAGITDADRP